MAARIGWAIALAVLGYLLLWPVSIVPVAWTPPPTPSLEEGPYARNEGLRGVQRLAEGLGQGPEAIAIDAEGRLLTGLEDGRVVSLDRDGRNCRVLGNSGGRPLGLRTNASGEVLIADAKRGLVMLATDGKSRLLADTADGIGLGFADDLDLDAQGRVYFSDASWKFGYGDHYSDGLEHGGRGRLLMWDPVKAEAYTLMNQLHFANGVALGPDGDYLLVNETYKYRIKRYWLRGDRAGQEEILIDNLPGFPDNLSFNGRDRFWVALYSPRNAMLDATLPHPWARQIFARLPDFMQPSPVRHAFILGLDLEGKLVEQYQFDGAGAYAPITSVREHQGWLYLGSLSQNAIGRISLDALRDGTSASEPRPAIASDCPA